MTTDVSPSNMTPEVSAEISAPNITSQTGQTLGRNRGVQTLAIYTTGSTPPTMATPSCQPLSPARRLPRCPLCRLFRTGLPSWTPSQSDPDEEGDPQSGWPSVLGVADTLLHTGSSHWLHPLTPLWTLRTSRHLSSWKIQTWSHWTPSQSCEPLVRKTNEQKARGATEDLRLRDRARVNHRSEKQKRV